MSAQFCCLACLALAWDAIASHFRSVEPENPKVECLCEQSSEGGEVELKRGREPLPVTAERLQEVMTRPTSKLTLTNCTFAEPISSKDFCGAALVHLEIYSPGGLQVTDDLSALAGVKSLLTLKLIRADFVNANGGRCYAALAQMTQLHKLDLDRTITLEKAPGESVMVDGKNGPIRRVTKLAPIVMDSLERLLEHSNLETLSLRWCTALTAKDVQRLRTVWPPCEILWEPSKQASDALVSSQQGATQRASAKEHKD